MLDISSDNGQHFPKHVKGKLSFTRIVTFDGFLLLILCYEV
jgi:hypothetical protein